MNIKNIIFKIRAKRNLVFSNCLLKIKSINRITIATGSVSVPPRQKVWQKSSSLLFSDSPLIHHYSLARPSGRVFFFN